MFLLILCLWKYGIIIYTLSYIHAQFEYGFCVVEENRYVKFFVEFLWYVDIGEDYTSQIIPVKNYSSQSRYRV